jgi:hypothetical protein
MAGRTLSLGALIATGAALATTARATSAPGPLSRLVTFGDSYSDTISVGDGGVAWPVYAVGYANATLFPFAKSGAVCDQELTPRPFPGVVQDELPAYFAEVKNLSIAVPPDETLYTLWIGTNDLGPTTLLLGQDVLNNATIVSVTQCAVSWVKTLYDSGARNILLQNVRFLLLVQQKKVLRSLCTQLAPLDRTILYQADSYPNRFWTDVRNTTEVSLSVYYYYCGCSECLYSGTSLCRNSSPAATASRSFSFRPLHQRYLERISVIIHTFMFTIHLT